MMLSLLWALAEFCKEEFLKCCQTTFFKKCVVDTGFTKCIVKNASCWDNKGVWNIA